MTKSPEVELIAVQPFMQLADYATAETFRARIEALFAKIGEVRERDAHGNFSHSALVVFPENIGTFLAVAGDYGLVQDATTVDEAIGRVVRRRLPDLAGVMLRHRVKSPTRAALLMLSRTVWPIYYRTFRDAAHEHDAWVVAGSAVVAPNRYGDDHARYAPEGGRVYNLSLTFSPTGHAAGEARKVNLVPTQEDVLGITPGKLEDLRPVDTEFGRVGTTVCYDGFVEPHTRHEPGWCAVGPHYDAEGVTILAQPAANPWPWDEGWVFADPGEDILRRDQWRTEGIRAQLAKLPHVRHAVTAQLLGKLLDTHFDGRSEILERLPDGGVKVLAEAERADCTPEAEAIVYARVPIERGAPGA